MAWAFQKNSELVECFNYHLQKMIEAGILDQLYSVYVDVKITTELDKEGDTMSLGYMNAAFPSLVLMGGPHFVDGSINGRISMEQDEDP